MYLTAKDSNAEKVRKEWNKFRMANDPIDRMYTHGILGRKWRMLAPKMRVLNPMCCKLIDGEQCHNPATVTHHLVSPRRDTRLFLEPTNLTTLCANCHPKEDTPNWRVGVDIVQTLYPKFSFGE
jgi:hypothetical protein